MVTGEWFVVLKDKSDVDKIDYTVAEHKKVPIIGSGGIQLKSAKVTPMSYLYSTRFFPYENDGTSVLVYQLPYRVNADLMHRFFYDYAMYPDGIRFGKHMESPLRNVAKVRFATADEAARAVRERNGRPLHQGAVEIFRYVG